MTKETKTIAVSYETYLALLDFKKSTKAKTLDETIRNLIKLSRLALAREVLDYIKSRKLSEEEEEVLKELRGKMRREKEWQRRF
ncbi:MAG: hypothetical protein B6U95_03245 [Thermofilum sp. ex4484_82]|nr:MAG: hypothetical protein B6U95_03245 [Thermofilum sp. ex4484_82]OYT38889.1 MAG: hypothetical protein B6U96_03235 [Archaeoglobales archaeon ex4484_92]